MSNPFQQSMVRMQVPPGMGTTIAARGFTFDADEDGCVSVPQDLAIELRNHGLTPAKAQTAEAAGKGKK